MLIVNDSSSNEIGFHPFTMKKKMLVKIDMEKIPPFVRCNQFLFLFSQLLNHELASLFVLGYSGVFTEDIYSC